MSLWTARHVRRDAPAKHRISTIRGASRPSQPQAGSRVLLSTDSRVGRPPIRAVVTRRTLTPKRTPSSAPTSAERLAVPIPVKSVQSMTVKRTSIMRGVRRRLVPRSLRPAGQQAWKFGRETNVRLVNQPRKMGLAEDPTAMGRLLIVDPNDPGTPPEVAETLSGFVLPPWTGPQNILATLADHGRLFAASRRSSPRCRAKPRRYRRPSANSRT